MGSSPASQMVLFSPSKGSRVRKKFSSKVAMCITCGLRGFLAVVPQRVCGIIQRAKRMFGRSMGEVCFDQKLENRLLSGEGLAQRVKHSFRLCRACITVDRRSILHFRFSFSTVFQPLREARDAFSCAVSN